MVNGKSYVVFDLDDVLANLRDNLMEMLRKRTGVNIHWRHWNEYKLDGIYGVSVEEIMQWVLEDEVLESATLEPDAIKALQTAKSAGYEVAVVTARAWHPNGESITENWLNRYRLDIDQLHLVPIFGDKTTVLKRIGLVHHYIDDHVDHIYSAKALRSVQNVHLLDRPWNRNDDRLPRIHRLREFIDLIKMSQLQ